MYRKSFAMLTSKIEIPKQHQEKIQHCLKTFFFRQFITHLDINHLINFCQIEEHLNQTVIFEQGEAIDKYYLLIAGKVLLERRCVLTGNKLEVNIIQGFSIIGEYFNRNHSKRMTKAVNIPEENPTIVLSIDQHIFNQLYATQILEYQSLKQKLALICSISPETLENRGLFRNISFKKYRFGEEFNSFSLLNHISIIFSGECILTNSGNISLIGGDYLNLEGYFAKQDRKGEVMSKYRVTSSQMQTCCLTFEFVDKLPSDLKQNLMFIDRCHEIAPSSIICSLNQSSLQSVKGKQSIDKKVILPRVKRNASCNKKEKSHDLIRQCEERISHKDKKINSINEKQIQKKQIERFRKMYRLGYQRKRDVQEEPLSPKKEVGEPKGFFQMPYKLLAAESSPNINRKQWALYVLSNSSDKQNIKKPKKPTIHKKNISPTKMQIHFQKIFSKQGSIQSLENLKGQGKINKKALKCPTKLFQFPIKPK